ncbi:hypothetical protein PENSPDRAFT_736258 [Peniophora sp. CONT]|nr:hypothetical protein PENSPDRAFT_736258 [Peniophora sp. CONT]
MAPKVQAVDLIYTLPPAVENIRGRWLTTLQSAGAVSGFLSAVEAQLLVFYKVANNFNTTTNRFEGSQSTTQNACLILTYIALIASVSGTMSSMLLVDEFAVVSARAARTGPLVPLVAEKDSPSDRLVGSDWQILAAFGFRRSASRLVTIHLIVSLALTCVCTIAAAATYAGTQEPLVTQIVVSIAAGLSVLPLVFFVLFR